MDVINELYQQVVGIPDDRMGEEICACVILKPGNGNLSESKLKEKIIDFCKGKVSKLIR